MNTPDHLQDAMRRANKFIRVKLFAERVPLSERPWKDREFSLFQEIIRHWAEVALRVGIPLSPALPPTQRTALRRRIMAVISGLGTLFDVGQAGDREGVRREMRRLELTVHRTVQFIEETKTDINEEKRAIAKEAYGGLLTTQQAARWLRLEPNTVVQHVRSGLIAAQRAGRVFLIPIPEAEKYEEMRRGRGRPRRNLNAHELDKTPQDQDRE